MPAHTGLLVVLVAIGWQLSLVTGSIAKGESPNGNGFDTSPQARQQALETIPWGRLLPEAQQRIRNVAAAPTMFRRLPRQQIECDGEMFLFLVRHPEILVGTWEIMGITKVQVQRTAPFHLESDDQAGTQCDIDLIYGDRHLHVFLAEGEYSGPLLTKPITGRGLFVLHSRFEPVADGGTMVVGWLDCFVQLDSAGADLVMRTFSGMIGKSADNNFAETARFIGQVSRAAKENPRGMVDLAGRLPQVQPEVREAYAEQCRLVYARSEQAVIPSAKR